jgi:hypothetical protein
MIDPFLGEDHLEGERIAFDYRLNPGAVGLEV